MPERPTSHARRGVLSLQEASRKREEARRDGRTVVQCHGCFDIVHPGHVRHLQDAAKLGDYLLVTVTSDLAMAKGEGRPLIPQELRAENLAALDCVDWACVDTCRTAAELLETLRPDIYVKGREYETTQDPRLFAEREVVERHGGRVVFSSGDIVFSSTALIAELQEMADPFHARVRTLIEQHDLRPERVDPLIERFRGTKVVVVGDTIVDTYIICDRPEIAGESPVMTLRPIEWRSYDGGAAIVAKHLAAMGACPTLVTGLPHSPETEAFRQRLMVEGVDLECVEIDRPPVEKQRFLVGTQKVMKLDLVQPGAMDTTRQSRLVNMAASCARGADAAIVLDFGNMLSPAMTTSLCKALRERVRILTGDVSGRRSTLLHMREMDLLCPSESEMREALNNFDDGLNAVVWRLLEQTGSRGAMLTMGADGVVAFDRVEQASGATVDWKSRIAGEHVPAFTSHAIDPLGCGDTLTAVATLALTQGESFVTAAALGSVAAAAQAERLGNAVIGGGDLRAGVRRVSGARLAFRPETATKPAFSLVS